MVFPFFVEYTVWCFNQERATLFVRCKHNAAWEQQQLTRAPRIPIFLILFKPLPTTNNNIFCRFFH